MASHSAFLFAGFLLVLCAAGSLVLGETGCPEDEYISPCICDESPTTRLVCSGINNISTIERVFRNSARHTYQEVHIRSTTVESLPSMIFDNVHIKELYIENTTVARLFNNYVSSDDLEKLQLDNVTVTLLGAFYRTRILRPFTNLKTLIVNDFRGSTVLGWDFADHLPRSLEQIIFRRTTIKTFLPRLFFSYENLDKFEISSSRLTDLTRNMFPKHLNKTRFLYFDNNNISYIPPDLFNNMPQLQIVSLKNNHITNVPESAFNNGRRILSLRLDGNPLDCNCLLLWMIKDKPEILGGTCNSPRRLQGRELQSLRPGDFKC